MDLLKYVHFQGTAIFISTKSIKFVIRLNDLLNLFPSKTVSLHGRPGTQVDLTIYYLETKVSNNNNIANY
jgi:hypothetical protein